jgi:hypothetical protein
MVVLARSGNRDDARLIREPCHGHCNIRNPVAGSDPGHHHRQGTDSQPHATRSYNTLIGEINFHEERWDGTLTSKNRPPFGPGYEPPLESWRLKDDGSRIGYDCGCVGSRHIEGRIGPREDHDWEGWHPVYAADAAQLEAELNEGNTSRPLSQAVHDLGL